MLSKTMAILLGIIERQPVNAYELNKWLSTMNVRAWYQVASSTVYATLKAAEKKGYITGNVEKAGNMPDKTVYTITEKGGKEFTETIRSYLSDFEYDITTFHIGIFFVEALEKSEAVTLMEKRITLLRNYINGLFLQIEKMENEKIPKLFILNTKQNLYIVQAHLAGGLEILSEFKKNTP